MIVRASSIIFIALFLLSQEAITAETKPTAEELIRDLACSACHDGLPEGNNIQDKAPDLSDAGLRFNSAYLFDYLQNPTKIRQHIGFSRMPNFQLNKKESLALVLFLKKQQGLKGEWPEFPLELNTAVQQYRQNMNLTSVQTLLNQFECTKCHSLGGEGTKESIDLSTLGYRLNPNWVKKYLAAPYVFDGLRTTMPSYFYTHDATLNKFVEILPQAAQNIYDLTKYLFSLNTKKQSELQRVFEDAKVEYSEVNASLGEQIFISLNCIACHKYSGKMTTKKDAPDLSIEGARVRKDWLKAYLKKPTSIRPFGFDPGSGSRMPDFNLSDNEVEVLTNYIVNQADKFKTLTHAFKPRKLSAFSMAKAETLLKEKLSCLGCHRLGEEGGRIAPDLSNIKSRLQSEFVYQMIQNPKSVVHETVMPKIAMPQKTKNLIVNYLLQQEISKKELSYLSLVDNPIQVFQDTNEERELYVRYCASCHGVKGDSDGFNTKYLPTRPTKFSDSVYMSNRPDDTLFDGVVAGGYILNKSHLMPPWGDTLERSEILKLVAYLRKLCHCEGPLWSRDNK